jgi:hypothetical protein
MFLNSSIYLDTSVSFIIQSAGSYPLGVLCFEAGSCRIFNTGRLFVSCNESRLFVAKRTAVLQLRTFPRRLFHHEGDEVLPKPIWTVFLRAHPVLRGETWLAARRAAVLSCCFRRQMGHLCLVTVSEPNETSSTEKLLLRALIISVLLHLLIVSVWREGQAQGWWRNLTLPHWMQLGSTAMMPRTPKKLAADLPSQSQLTFVEVDPALATPAPPKKPKFQGAKNTLAANREIKVLSAMPNIDGRQEKYLKTTANAKPKPKPHPATPTPLPSPSQPQNTARQNVPKRSYTPGDLAMARPSDKPQDGKTDAEAGDQAQPQPQPQPAYQKPRTIAEALARSGNYGQLTRQAGGVPRVSPNVSLDVQGTPLGDYISRMVEVVQSRWYQLLENQSADVTGKVVLHFRLHPDGRVTDLKTVQNEVTDLLAFKCEQAVKEPAPYEKWSREMRLSLPTDSYDITFTFYYENY